MHYRRPINESVAHALQGFVTINEMVVSSANVVKLYADHADVAPIMGIGDSAKLAFKDHPDAVIVPVDSLMALKNQNDDPKYQNGLKEHPVTIAAKFMAKAITGGAERRDPISVRDNGDGTYEVLDGNATSQAAMMANWDEMPVLIQGQEPGGTDPSIPA